MKIQKTEVKTFIEHWVCEECNRGTLEKSSIQHLDIREDRIYVPHKCTVCENTQFLKGESYPKTVYEYL